ncbi:AAA family ATPase [Streptomyces sp. G-5]|uniref:AAA family ATPase n=1 Tax=Streptomyces sp. G-5 TaxID=2977231 RepID=UPI0021D2840D|nr:AAA family ATPase [Streptomyces sp. G-5]MCU4750050.1 AAA family ATPase [Streptomyces sp. G-5]
MAGSIPPLSSSSSRTAPPTRGPAASAGKARPGELRAKVAGLLAADTSAKHTVTELARQLGHSGGAVGQACETLVERGEAERTGSSPRVYRATPATAATARRSPASSTGPVQARRTTATTRTPRSAAAPYSGRGPVVRPGGQEYHPRSLADLPDVEVLRRLREAEVPVLLYGPPGTGKTSLIEAAFPDLITVAGDGDTTVGDLLGEYTQRDGGGYEFVYGPVVTAMREGRALLLDDATLISPKVLAAMYPAMDGRRQIQVKAHKGETITAQHGFYVVAGHNPGVHGAVLTEALASRFAMQIRVTSDYDLAAALNINGTAVRVARNLAKLREADEIGWAPQLRELIAFQKIADVLSVEVAFANLIGIAPPEDQDTVATVVTKATGSKTTALALGKQLPPGRPARPTPAKGATPPPCSPGTTSSPRRR